MKAAITLNDLGIASVLVEKEAELGGKVKNYDKTFPFFHSGKEIVRELESQVEKAGLVEVRSGTTISHLTGVAPNFRIKLENDDQEISASAIVMAAGFEPFDASLQEEYGYSVYQNVITATEMERLLDPTGPTGGELKRPSDGRTARNVAIIFCVGSRSEKLGHNYCSRICCSFSTKQAIEIKEKYPDSAVTCFYIDIRTYGRGFEEMYRWAQETGVTYIRGRVAECGAQPNGDITIKAEDTFLGKPIQGDFDLVCLAHGMTPCADASRLATMLNVKLADDGFFDCRDNDLYPFEATRNGVFLAGAVTGLKPIPDCITDGSAVASRIAAFLAGKTEERK